MRSECFYFAIILLIVGLLRMDDTSPAHLRLGYFCIGAAVVLLIVALVCKDENE